MFEITGDDIATLNDADLRTLIGLLCEAEMCRRGLPTSAVTYGGNQDAKDEGLDVRVALQASAAIEGFVPKPATGFQVKKPDMPRGEILKEMRPKGSVRPVILQLGATDGAYIIVSSTGSTSDSALTKRRNAMADGIKGTPAEGKVALDFYDRSRVATWVRDHPGLIPWVRSRIGKAMTGWQSYGSWSLAPAGIDASYLTDDKARIRTGDKDEGEGLSAIEGINHIRRVLVAPGQVVRLVGLSGVGKTRLAEALFDASVGQDPLDPSLAIYTNEADQPIPPPAGLASDLVAGQTRAILVVDNCTPELHRRLSEVVRSVGSTISLITIEYDIRDDQPEGTNVFALETSSVPLIEKLVERRYPHLSQIDAHTIADFSGGNARVAFSLASQIDKTETVTSLNEEELFRRLFQQRNDPNPSLLLIAQACSLVYSFDGETFDGPQAELSILGTLVGKSADEIYAGVAELKQRDLVQARGQWRALLPHAIANRLAKRALQTFAPAKVNSALVDNASERLLRSFSRRLGYLDDCQEAQEIVKGWFATGGLLSDLANLNELGVAMFTNVAPVAPETALAALERAITGVNETLLGRLTHFVTLLRSLAYEPALFKRALALLVNLAALPSGSTAEGDAAAVFVSLFHIYLSGTLAPVEMRAEAARALLASGDPAERRLGLKALEAMMKTSMFSSHYGFDFGARSRNFGYYPRTSADVRGWFAAALKLAEEFALSDSQVAGEVQNALAREFRGLWRDTGQAEELDRLARAVSAKAFWRDGWIGARQARIYDGKSMSPVLRDRLAKLEEFLRPKDLLNQIRGIVNSPRGSLDLDDFDDDDDQQGSSASYSARAARSGATIRVLGQDVATDENTLKIVLPELMAGNHRVFLFGEALGAAAESPRSMWDSIVAQFAKTENANLQLIAGFLRGVASRDRTLTEALIEEALEHPALASSFPILQSSLEIDERALARLHRSLDLGKAPITAYDRLSYGRVCDNISAPEFRDLVLAISRKPEGLAVGLQMLVMRLHSDSTSERQTLPEVREAGLLILAAFEFPDKEGGPTLDDHDLGAVARVSLAGMEGALIVGELCRKFMVAARKGDFRAFNYDELMKSLLELHPLIVLDELFSGGAKSRRDSVLLLNSLLQFNRGVLDVLTADILTTWCDLDPATRYPLAASVVLLFKRPKPGEPHQWTEVAGKLLEKAPDPPLVLKEIVRRLHPSSWSGSLVTKLEERLRLLDSLPWVNVPALAGLVAEERRKLQAYIEGERRREQEEDRSRNNRFE